MPPSSEKVYESCILTGLYGLSGPKMLIISKKKYVKILFGFALCLYFGT